MYSEKKRDNWTQIVRRKNLALTAKLIEDAGGYTSVLNDIHDFERYLALMIGCSIKTAKEYVETVRGALLFATKNELVLEVEE